MKLRAILSIGVILTIGCSKMHASGGVAEPQASARRLSLADSPAAEMADDATQSMAGGSGRPGLAIAALGSVPASRRGAVAPQTDELADTKAIAADPGEGGSDLDVFGHHLIYEAQVRLGVADVERALERATELAKRYRGYLHAADATSMVLRVPTKELHRALSDFSNLGVVLDKTMQAGDVTAEYVDIESRIATLEQTKNQLLALLSMARSVKDALAVRQALTEVTTELEVLKGRLRQLQNLIAFSTITLSFEHRGPNNPIEGDGDPFRWVDELGVETTEWNQ